MEKMMLAIGKFKEGEDKFEKFMAFFQSDEGMAMRKSVAHVEKTVPGILPDKSRHNVQSACAQRRGYEGDSKWN